MIALYRYRVMSLNGLLNTHSRMANDVWNFCNDTQKHALKWGTLSTGEKLPNDRFGRHAAERLPKAQRARKHKRHIAKLQPRRQMPAPTSSTSSVLPNPVRRAVRKTARRRPKVSQDCE